MGPTRQARLRGASTPWQPPPPPECPGVGPSEAVHGRPPLGIELAVGLQVQPTAAGPGMHGFTPPKEQRGRVSPLRACASARGHPQTGPGCPNCGAGPGGVWRGRAPAPRSHLGCPPGPLASHCPHDATVPLAGQVEGPSCLLSSAGPGPAPNPCCEPRCPHGGWKPVSELVRNDQ